MAWYEAHQTLAKHPKTLRLASLINCERRYAVGLLHDLFTWGLDAAKKDGTIPGLSKIEIASALDFTGKKGASVVDALVESGYLEIVNGCYKIHDWYDYAGKFVDKRESDKQRKKEKQEHDLAKNGENGNRISNGKKQEKTKISDGNPAEIQWKERGNPCATVPNLTKPNITRDSVCKARAPAREETASAEDGPDADRWGEFWDAYPRKNGGDIREACMEYLHVVDSGVPPDVLITAAQELAKRTTRETFRYLPSAEKWLRNKGWLEHPPDEEDDAETNNVFLKMYEKEHGGT